MGVFIQRGWFLANQISIVQNCIELHNSDVCYYCLSWWLVLCILWTSRKPDTIQYWENVNTHNEQHNVSNVLIHRNTNWSTWDSFSDFHYQAAIYLWQSVDDCDMLLDWSDPVIIFLPWQCWVIVIIVRVFPVAGNKSIVPISLPNHCHSPPPCRATINIQDTTSYHTQQHTWLFGNLHMYHTQSIVLEFGAILVWWWYNVRFRQCLVLPCCISTKNFPINLIQFAGKLLFSKIISEFVN